MNNVRHIAQRIWEHPWTGAACNMLLIMGLYSASRLFFYLINLDLYPGIQSGHLLEMLLGGMRFDLTAVIYLSSVYLLLVLLPLPTAWRSNRIFTQAQRWWFIIPNAIGLAVNCVDMAYIRFTDRRTTCTFFSEFQNEGNMGDILRQGLTDYWPVTLFGMAAIVLLLLCFRTVRVSTTRLRKPYYYAHETIILLCSVYFLVIGIRGGFGKYTRPITISNAMEYVERPAETAIVLNTPFSLMKSLENETYVNPAYFSEQELENIMSPVHPADSIAQPLSPHKNVVVIILESFASEHIGYFNRQLEGGTYQGYTPFLDSLLSQSVTFTHSYASGRKSIDALPSVLSSIPMLIEPYVVTPYSTNSVSSIADVLQQEGYTTAFYHGAPNGSMGFWAYARSAGFSQYYGMDEFNAAMLHADAFDGTWAIWDEEFLQYYCQSMSRLKEPFCTAVFTASSHHPFKIPSRYEGLFPEGKQPLCKCIAYTDFALREFFREAKKQPWYANTLFVITADHTNQLYHQEYLTDEGLFRVPIAFFSEGMSARTDSTEVVSQTDIMPSTLALLGYSGPFFAFGEDAVTHSKQHNYAICYNHPYYQIISRDAMLQFDGQKVVSVQGHLSEAEQAEMVQFLKAYIQQYILRMTGDQLTIWPKKE